MKKAIKYFAALIIYIVIVCFVVGDETLQMKDRAGIAFIGLVLMAIAAIIIEKDNFTF